MSKKRIYIAGHKGMVGRAIVRRLALRDDVLIVTKGRAELDLTDQAAVAVFFAENAIDEVYLCAAKVGGIQANNTFPADFLYENLMIQTNVIHGAHESGVDKLLFLGSSCIYPKFADQPIAENALMTGTLEPTNEPYAVAKIAGIKLCESYNRQFGRDYRSVMPCNLFGSFDNFHLENSHVIPALLRRFHEAVQSGSASISIWGSGNVRREFLHVDDMADGCVHIMGLPENTIDLHVNSRCSHINIGAGVDCTITELAVEIARVTGFAGALEFDDSKPEGTPQKLLDISLADRLGWTPKMGLRDGLKLAYDWFLENQHQFRK